MFLNVTWKLPFEKRRHLIKTLLIMKFIAIFLFAAGLQVSATGYSQTISIAQNNVSLKKVFREIERQSGYQFFYKDRLVRQTGNVSINVRNATIENVLKECFKNQPLTYTMVDKIVVVKEKKHIELISSVAVLPTPVSIITGTVKDDKGNPLVGVSVIVKGTTKGTSTATDGSFSIDADKGDVLEFSMVGYKKKSVIVGSAVPVNIQMEIEVAAGSEIVVVGYGTQKKVNLTGAVGVVTAKQLEDRPVTNVTNALQGTVPGVTIVQNNGQPGKDGGSINIRGIGTLNNANPLVIVDGIISSMNDVNPSDIESISVLKDAASSAIYGSRAANGVILITTKKGKKGTAQIHYDGYVGKQKATDLPDYLPSWQAATLYNDALNNEGKTPRWTADEIQKFKDGSDPYNYPNTDWLGLFYKGDGIQQNHYVDVSGGSDKSQYLFSLGYFDQDGIVPHTNAKRYTTRLNLNSIVSDRLKVNADIAYTFAPLYEPTNPYTGDFSQIIRQINRISPTVPYKYANGAYGYISDGSPMAWLEEGALNKQNRYALQGIAGADWEILNGLHFKPSMNYRLVLNQNNRFVKDIQYYDHVTGLPSKYQGPNSLTDYRDNTTVTTLQALVDYTKKIGKNNFYILGGYSQEYTNFSWDQGYRQGFLNNNLSQLNPAPVDGQQATGSANELALQSYFGRVTYNYDNRYLLEGNIRYDGSSRFAPPNRWGLFPSFSAGWRISEEEFFQSLKPVFSDLKLRGSWGKLGNQNTVDASGNATYYPYVGTISPGQQYVFGGTSPSVVSGVAPVNGANTNIQWESTTMSGVGVDAAFLSNKLTFSADYFVKNTNNILLVVPVGAAFGYTAPTQNAASVSNKGWEFIAGYNDRKGEFTYNVGINAAFIKNEVTSLDSTSPIISGGRITKVGWPIRSYYGYIAEGIFQTQAQVDAHAKQSGGKIGPGDLIYKDLNGDSVIDGNDRTYLGTSFPKITFGFNLGASWKGIDISIFLQGAAGIKNYVQGIMLGQVSDGPGKPTSAMLDAWTPQNTNASFPRLWYGYTQNDPSRTTSSFWVRNASYVRLKNLQVGYTLPQSWMNTIGIKKARIYYSGQNILTFSKFYKWVDPEAPSGDNGYTYPQVKVNTIGISVNF